MVKLLQSSSKYSKIEAISTGYEYTDKYVKSMMIKSLTEIDLIIRRLSSELYKELDKDKKQYYRLMNVYMDVLKQNCDYFRR